MGGVVTEWGDEVERYERDARVVVIDLRTSNVRAGYVVEDRGGPAHVVIRYDDGALIRVGRAFVRPEP